MTEDGITPNWRAAPESTQLAAGDVHLWLVALKASDDDLKHSFSILDSIEQERADRFHFQRDRTRYILSHCALRKILAFYTGKKESSLEFEVTSYGKPSLVGGGLEFNLSHSHELALIGVTQNSRIGVDVEHFRPNIECKKLAARFFSAPEIERLDNFGNEEVIAAFFHCWTRKEAYIKAIGEGLSMPLDSFAVSIDPLETSVRLETFADSGQAQRWSIHAFTPIHDYAAAVAVEIQKPSFQFFNTVPDM